MGVWATGLYAGDFALDLRSTIGAVANLPFESDRQLEILCESERGAADRADDADHTTFWLVVADQFAKRGIENKRAREIALEIIDSNQDLAMLEKLGMQAADLRKRKKVLDEVRERIVAPIARTKPRETIKKPQELLMQTGDVLVYPTFGGRCRNPYFVDQDKDRMGSATLPWRADSWAAMVIVDCGRAFDFLAWYRPLTVVSAMAEKPDLGALRGEMIWKLGRPGTSTASHFKRMGFEKIGALDLDPGKLTACFGEFRPGTSAAVSNTSITNQISVGPYSRERIAQPGTPPGARPARPTASIDGLVRIVK
jgi:hypothetical protein